MSMQVSGLEVSRASPEGTLQWITRLSSLGADWQRHRLHPQTRRRHPFLLSPSRIKSPRPSSHSELDCTHRPRRLWFSTAIRLRNLKSTRLPHSSTV